TDIPATDRSAREAARPWSAAEPRRAAAEPARRLGRGLLGGPLADDDLFAGAQAAQNLGVDVVVDADADLAHHRLARAGRQHAHGVGAVGRLRPQRRG